ncbi:MAG: carbohydrate porin [Verrucomicrobiales bacterium]|nr:carbohydrate porin [Verrucomicrobiales bacterium]
MPLLASALCAATAIGAPSPEPDPVPARPDPIVSAGGTQEPEIETGTLLPDWGGHRERLARHGLTYAVGYVAEVVAVPDGGLDDGAVAQGLLRVELDLDTAQAGAWAGGQFHVSSLTPHGDSASSKYLGDLFVVSNIDALDSCRLFELWYQHQLVPDRLSLRFGQLAADEEFGGTEFGSVFINSTFGWLTPIAANAPSPAYPVGTPGARLELTLDGGWTVRAAVYNGDPFPYDDQGEPENDHGTHLAWRDALLLLEAQWSWNDAPTDTALPGSVKLGGWHHTGTFQDFRRGEDGRSLADAASTGIPIVHRGNSGGYLALDQQLTRESTDSPEEGLGVFSRLGGAPGDRSLLEWYAEAGLTYTGLFRGRAEDVLGVGWAFGRVGHHARGVAEDARDWLGATDAVPDYEMVVETTYRLQVRPGFALQPVVSYLIHPGGTPGNDALALALRASLDF